jgi:TatD DNase family protein
MLDIHCHLTGDEYAELGGADGVLFHAKQNGISTVVCSGFDLDSSIESAEIAARHDGVYFCAGFHPSELDKFKDGDLERLFELCKNEKCVAVGEIGLDYHFDDNPPKDRQKELFVKQMQIANELGLPIVIHSRDAALDTLTILQENVHLLKRGGLLHCYSYSPEMVESFVSLGLYFSFGGPCTFKNARKVQDSVRLVPATRILSETDSPYLTPVPHRGEFPNQPKHVKHSVEMMAMLRGVELTALEKQIEENAKRLFPKIK